MSTPRSRLVSAAFAASCLWPLLGCGPAAIAVAIGSQGGGSSRTVTDPSGELVAADSQPEDGTTRLRWRLKRGSGAEVQFWLECRVGTDDRGRIPSNWVSLTQGSAQPGNDDSYVATPSSGGDEFEARWDHASWLGQREIEDVTVTLLFRDASRADGKIGTTQLLNSVTIGREVATVSEPITVDRVADEESEFRIQGVWSDAADDMSRGIATLDVDMAYRFGPNGPEWEPVVTGVVPELTPRNGNGTHAYGFEYRFSPLRGRVPFGVYPQFAVRVTSRERFAADSRFPAIPPVELRATPRTATIATTVGRAPRLLSVTVPDPDQNGSDPRRPFLQAPLTLVVFNPSQEAVRIGFKGTYRINNTGDPLAVTFARTAEAGTRLEIELAAGEVRPHYLIWNVLADEGLGLRVTQSMPQVARVLVKAEVATMAGITPVASERESNGTTLNTPPFVGFPETLFDDIARVSSAGKSPRTQRTRDVFYTTRSPLGPQEYVIAVDQRFAPVVRPGLAPFDFRQAGRSNGMTSVYPTDLLADRPDCIGQFADNQFPFYYVAWNRDNAPPDVTLIEPRDRLGGGDVVAGGVKGAEFTVAADGRMLPGVVFLNRDALTATDEARIYLKSIVFFGYDQNQQPVFRPNTTTDMRVMPRNPDGSAMPLGYHIVSGDFDGDENTTEMVLGNVGVERATPAAPGWFDVFRVEADPMGPVGTVRLVAVTPNPLPAVPAGPGRDLAIDPWSLIAWPNPTQPGRPGLLLARTFRNGPSRNDARLLHTFDVLEQHPSGGFAGSAWRSLGTLTDAAALGKGLEAVFAVDLDGAIDDKIPAAKTPELLAAFKKTRTATMGDRDKIDLRLLVNRRGTWGWRTVFEDLEPATTDDDKFQASSTQLVDLNGDDFLDLVFQEYRSMTSTLDSEFVYYSSALTGVAGGLANLNSVSGSRRPAVADLDGDGYADIVSRGLVHRGLATGEFPDRIGGFEGSFDAAYQVDRILRLGSDRGRERDLVVHDAQTNRAAVQTVLVTKDGVRNLINPGDVVRLTVQPPGTIRDLRSFLPRGRTGVADAKDLAVTVSTGAEIQLYRGALVSGSFVATPWLTGLGPAAEVTTVRKGPLASAPRDPSLSTLPEDVLVGLVDTNQVRVLRSDRDYAVESLTVPAGIVVQVAAASVTEDDLEDLLVLTDEAGVLRLWCVPQQGTGGYGQPSDARLLLQFSDAPRADFRGLTFDRGTATLANGIVVFQDVVRFVLPRREQELPQPFRAAMIRSTLVDPVRAPLGLLMLDTDADAQAEVFCGESAGAAARILRINRGFR